MMTPVDQPTPKRPAIPYPTLPDGKYKYTAWDGQPRHFKPTHLPEIGKGPILPVWMSERLRRLFKRPTPSVRGASRHRD
jgi:hypothetical protein